MSTFFFPIKVLAKKRVWMIWDVTSGYVGTSNIISALSERGLNSVRSIVVYAIHRSVASVLYGVDFCYVSAYKTRHRKIRRHFVDH